MSGLDATLTLEGYNQISPKLFRRGPMRKAFRQAGQVVAKDARKKISARAAGFSDYPSRRTGRLQKSIRVRVSKAGLLVKVFHEKRPDQKDFYAAFLHYGTSRGLKAKDNWIADALADRAAEVRRTITRGLDEALS